MIRKAILSLMLLFGAITMHAATGTSCYDAIPLGKDYSETINGPKTVWYVAKTFDLPIKVCFTPLNTSLPAPDVEMDFTCIPGVYEDSILCSLFCKGNTTGVTFDMPHKPALQLEDGAYCISMGKRYRDLLLQAGISYNVEVYDTREYAKSCFSLCEDNIVYVFDEKSPEFRRYKKERLDGIRKKERERDKLKKEYHESLLYSIEYSRKKKEEDINIIDRDRLGFDNCSFKGEEYHGQKRKKKDKS